MRFLAHELRTPLQSSALALAALDRTVAPEPLARLARALQRLERASAAVLWLGETAPVVEPVSIAPVVRALVEEFGTLAERRSLSIQVDVDAGLRWSLPVAAVEAVLGNLLINAIQHGAPGLIHIDGDKEQLELRNPVNGTDDRPEIRTRRPNWPDGCWHGLTGASKSGSQAGAVSRAATPVEWVMINYPYRVVVHPVWLNPVSVALQRGA